jgi:hypothetical protein
VNRRKKRGEPFNPFTGDASRERNQRKYGISGAQQNLKDYESVRLSKLHDLIDSLVIPPFDSDYPGRLKALKEMIRGTNKKNTPTVLDKKRNVNSSALTDLDKKRKEVLTRMSDAKPSGASGISKQNQQQQSTEKPSSREERLMELRRKSDASKLNAGQHKAEDTATVEATPVEVVAKVKLVGVKTNAKPRSEPAPYRPVTKLSERKQYEVDIINKLKNNGSPYLRTAESIAEHLSRFRKMRNETKNSGNKRKYKKLIDEYRNEFDQIANKIKD